MMPLLNRFAVRWVLVFLIGAALVAGCYRYLDVPLARWAYRHQLRQYGLFHGLQALADGLVLLAPVALLAVGGRWLRGRTTLLDRVALLAAGSVLAVSLLKYPLKWAFGRTWPATFYQNNPSLLHDGVYGFHPFQGGVAYGAFPSGHAAVAAAVATVLWVYYPRYRLLAVGLWLAVSVGLLGAYYHFASDVLAGTLLGVFVASLVRRFDVRASEPRSPNSD
ncbi:MAG: phosphatase PAP2 family protein [Candidatus Competibacteraceae bacterium]